MIASDPRLTLRPAVATDKATVIAMVNAMADCDQMPKLDAEAQQRLVRDAFERKKFEMVLADWEGKAVGYVAFFEAYSTFEARPTLFIDDLFVVPEYRGRHVGYELFRYCLAESQKRDCGRMEWLVLENNRSALGFYDRLKTHQLKGWAPFRMGRNDIDKLVGQSPR